MSRRGFFLRGAFVLPLVIFLGNLSLRAEDDPYPTGPEAGRKLAAELRQIRPLGSTNTHGVLKILGRGHKIPLVPMDGRVVVTETNWTVTYVTKPTDTNLAEKFTVIFSPDGPNRYFYARADAPGKSPGEPKELASGEADIPIGGSDFWLSDLGLEFLHWPDQNRLKGDISNSRGRYVLVSINPHPAPGHYSQVKTWIDKEADQPTEAEAYQFNSTNKVMKRFILDKVAKNSDGSYQVKEMIMHQGEHFRTHLMMDVDDDKVKN